MVIMNVVITGGSGFVGSYLCEKLINDGHKIIGHRFSGKYLDCGTMNGYIKSSMEISKL